MKKENTAIIAFTSLALACVESIRADVLGYRAQTTFSASEVTERETVLLLHGIGKSSFDMAPLAASLRRRGYHVVNWKYPSRRHAIECLAQQLADLVSDYSSTRVHFVTHSMGGIVVRHYLRNHRPENVGRFVMIGTPNQGAYLADKLSGFFGFDRYFGPAGRQLCQGELGACASAGIPECEFGIIAGGLGWRFGMNPIVPGDNDGTVSVESTRLDGAADFIVLPYAHPVIPMMPRTIENTVHFLQTGHFAESHASDQCCPAVPEESR